MARREVNDAERYLLAHYQQLMKPAERMVGRSLVAADFDVRAIPKTVWRRVWREFPGEHRDLIDLPAALH